MDTHGWDTVFLIAADKVNAALAANSAQLVMEFNADPGTDPPVLAKGKYSSWKIVPGGSERWLYLALEVNEGKLSIGEGTPSPVAVQFGVYRPRAQATEYDLSGVTIVLAVDLRLLRDAVTEGDRVEFNLLQAGTALPPAGEGYVTPVNVIDPSGKLDRAAQSLLGFAIADDLVKNREKVRYIFAYINPVPPAKDSWLAPQVSDYSYSSREGGGESFLAILSMTRSVDISGMSRAIDPADIKGEVNASFIISRDLTLEKLILPILPQAYQTTGDSFRFDKDKGAIVNGRTFRTFSVKSGAITYYPEITSFELRIEGNGIRTAIRGKCDMKAGIWMSFYVNSWNEAVFDPGSKLLTFRPDPNPISDSNADIPWYLYFLGLLVIAITEICVKVISKDIASKLSDLLKSALSITQNPPRVVEWTGTEGFDVTNAGLEGALYMMGTIREKGEAPGSEQETEAFASSLG